MPSLSELQLLDQAETLGALIALLIAGHVLADFLFQRHGAVTRRSASWPSALRHLLVVGVTQAVCLVPFFSLRALAAVAWIAVSHCAIDILQERWRKLATLVRFGLDQLAHLAALAVSVPIVLGTASEPTVAAFWEPWLPDLTRLGILVAAYVFVGNGGGELVAGVLEKVGFAEGEEGEEGEEGKSGEPAPAGPAGRPRMGWMIGLLERLVALTLVLLGEWGALGLVLAAKSLARFKDLDERHFGDYYLVGTLASLLVAILTGLAVQVLI